MGFALTSIAEESQANKSKMDKKRFSEDGIPTLAKLVQELNESNSEILEGQFNLKSSVVDIDLHKSQNDWTLNYDFGYADSNLETAPFYTASPQKNYTHGLTISKKWYHGGEFSFSNNIETVEGTNSFGFSGEINGFTQGLKYTLDIGSNFLGRKSKNELTRLKLVKELNKSISLELEDEKTLNLAVAYTQAKLAIANVLLDENALKRSEARESLIKKRVNDGLKLKVDLYQTQNATRAQRETLENTIISKNTTFERLGVLLHREVVNSDVGNIISEDKKNIFPRRSEDAENTSYKILKRKLEISNSTIENYNFSKMPSVKLSAAYLSNDFDPKLSKSLSQGAIGSDSNEFQVGIKVSWAIGSYSAKLSKSKAVAEKILTQKKD